MGILRAQKHVSSPKRIAVIGAGWAGASAAVELANDGAMVDWFEASRSLGGRARAVELHDLVLDNGQHILLGAYTSTLRLLKLLNIDQDHALLRLPLQMVYPHQTGMQFIAPHLPAPLHLAIALLRTRGLRREDKLSLARFSTTAKWMDWQLNQDCTVSELLERYQQTPNLIELMWRPLCLAALNTAPELASANVFLAVLRDSLGAKRSASDMLLPRTDLSRLMPTAAAEFITQHQGKLVLGQRIDSLRCKSGKWQLQVSQSSDFLEQQYDAIIIAAGPEASRQLLNSVFVNDVRASELHETLPAFDYEPITTCYLQYEQTLQLTRPFFALRDRPEQGYYGQFVFDRGQLNSEHTGLLAVVVSASSAAVEQDHSDLSKAVAQQLAEQLQLPALSSPLWCKVIHEKRATFRCTPALARPTNQTPITGLALAGDYTQSEYPATLETAVRSGHAAAQHLISSVLA